jgi:hypothetical protein
MTENRRPYVKVRGWEWRGAGGTKTPGVGILRGQALVAHLTPAEARHMADRLHDMADQMDAGPAFKSERNSSMFISKANYYARNVNDGEQLRTRPAILEGPGGDTQGVAILAGNMPRLILREDHAIALCNAIVDSLEEHRAGGTP